MSCERQILQEGENICNRDIDCICSVENEVCYFNNLISKQVTENGAVSNYTTGDPRLDLFFKSVRDINIEEFLNLLMESWNISSIDTIKTMFYLRDCREGKGEKKLFLWFLMWLRQIDNKKEIFDKIIKYIPHYGCYKDLKKLYKLSGEKEILKFWCSEILLDKILLREGKEISLAAKWLPVQNSDFSQYFNMTHKQFRNFVKPLRERLNIVEQKMSSLKWDEIDFEKVPSIALKRYNNCFIKNCEQRYKEFMKNVKNGNKKLNVKLIEPYEIISDILYHHQLNDEYIENAWNQLISMNKNKSKSICVVDVSGSMYGLPITVAIALGIYCSELNKNSVFYNKIITFSNKPELIEIKGNNLKEKVNSIHRSNWNMNTNIELVFDLILCNTIDNQKDCPDNIIILSDMQFDQVEGDGNVTNYENIQRKYEICGMKRPKLIFWNLRGNTPDFPCASNIPDCVLVSGFSKNILSSIMETGSIDPMKYYRKIIDSDRYKQIKV
jgi:hypothetical protein